MKFPWPVKILLVLLGLGVILGVIVGVKAAQIGSLLGFVGESEKAGLPPVAVASAEARRDAWEDVEKFTGSLRAVQGGMLTSEASGLVKEILVENGSEVKEGQLLVRIDSSEEMADLASAEAALRLAKINRDRAEELIKKRIIARSEFDTAKAEYDQASARVEELKALIDKKMVRAPFSGTAGIRLVNVGEAVRQGDRLIPVHASDPIFVDFSVPQTKMSKLKVGQPIRVSTDGLDVPAQGVITAINPVFEEETRTALVQGTLRNEDERLRAGQFAEVEVVLPQKLEVLSIPLSSVVAAPYGSSVFVVEGEPGSLTVRQQFVKLGPRRGDFISVEKGLEPGDRVVSAGAFKLRNGAKVTVNDEMQPEPSLEPQPDNS